MPRFDITIAGELNLDLLFYGLPRVMEAERELLASDFFLTLGSSSAILAHNLSVLGTKVGFITSVADDAFGRTALDFLRHAQVDLSKVAEAPGIPSGLTVLLIHSHDRHIVTYPGTIVSLSRRDLDFDYLADTRHFHLSSLYLQRALLADLPELFQRLKRAGVRISLDTNDDPDDRWDTLDQLLPNVDILLPNERELCKLSGTDDVAEALRRMSSRVPLLVVKRGAQGALACRGDEQIATPALAVEAIDSVGAGDSFNAGFLHAYLRGEGLASCLLWGNAAGALSTQRRGGIEAFRDGGLTDEFLRRSGLTAHGRRV
jgi:sugar/nucleoside kinase (ribokinase family)